VELDPLADLGDQVVAAELGGCGGTLFLDDADDQPFRIGLKFADVGVHENDLAHAEAEVFGVAGRRPRNPIGWLLCGAALFQAMTILVRTRNDPATLVSALRNAVQTIDPTQPVTNIRTLDQIVSDSIAQPRLNMLLMGLFGGLALILAAVGIYGLLSYAVTERTREIGTRMALGAQVPDVLRLVLKQGMTLALIGELIGLVGAFALTRVIRGLLFGVAPTDAMTFIAVAAVLTSVALLACYFPARRAAKVDPLVALRHQ